MALTLAIIATLSPTTPGNFCCVTEGYYLLDFHVKVEAKDALAEGDALRFSFRNLFNDEITSCERRLSIEQIKSGEARVQLTPDDVTLAPASYHVRVDIIRDGESLSGPLPGSCELYVCREGESANHVLGSYFISRAAFAWHPERKLYNRSIPKLPPAIDPFDPDAQDMFWKKVGDNWELHPELQHDGAVAFLHGAEVFRKTGEMDRAQFCETVLKRTIETVIREMLAQDGKLHAIKWQGDTRKEIYHIRQQDCFVLKLMSQAYLYFRDVAGDKEYAESILARIQPMVKYNFSEPNPLGCGGGCKVYDGRILAGLAYYCLTEKEASGEFNEEHVKTTLDFAERAARHCLAARGWYDENCYVEGKCHIGFGTQNILCGLLPSRRIALATGNEKLAQYLADAIMAGFDFLARTNGYITGYIQWIPSRHSQWANGNTHEILDEIRDQNLANSETRKKMLDWYFAKMWQPTHGFWVLAFHRCDILATPLLECEEYKASK